MGEENIFTNAINEGSVGISAEWSDPEARTVQVQEFVCRALAPTLILTSR